MRKVVLVTAIGQEESGIVSGLPCPSGSRYCPQPMGTLAGVPTLVVCVCADGWGNVKTRRHMFHSASSDVELGISLDVLKLKEGNRIK